MSRGEPAQERALQLQHTLRHSFRGLQIQHRRTLRAQARALKNRRQPARLPISDSDGRQTLRIIQNDVGGQILILAAQTVDRPGSEGGAVWEDAPALHQEHCGSVSEIGAEHGTNQGNIVRVLRQVRHHLRNFNSGLPMLGKLEGRRHHAAHVAHK